MGLMLMPWEHPAPNVETLIAPNSGDSEKDRK